MFKTKRSADGTVERHKARLVVQGYTQQYGQDYDETFSPVVRFESLRTVMALSVQNGLKLHQMDVTTAFLNGELKEEVYMRQPEGYTVKGKENLVCRLEKSIYGLKQSSRCWNSALDTHLKKMGFVQSAGDPCLYMSSEGEMFLIAVYVDDILLAGESDKRMAKVKQEDGQSQTSSLTTISSEGHGRITLLPWYESHSRSKHRKCVDWPAVIHREYAEKIWYGEFKPIRTPVDTSTKLVKAKDEDTCVDQQLYQSAVGSLLYLSIATRPDIAYAISNVAKFCAKPTKQHWVAVKRILRYLRGTHTFGLLYNNLSQI